VLCDISLWAMLVERRRLSLTILRGFARSRSASAHRPVQPVTAGIAAEVARLSTFIGILPIG
jgi:hypothetical protein